MWRVVATGIFLHIENIYSLPSGFRSKPMERVGADHTFTYKERNVALLLVMLLGLKGLHS